MPKLDLAAIPESDRTGYPPDLARAVAGRRYRKLALPGGLADFGVSWCRLAPGAWSSHRHWHEGEDEFLVMLAGEAVLVDEAGRTTLAAGDCAAFPKHDGNGHHLVNESTADCLFVVVGRASASPCHYPDVDLALTSDGRFTRKDGRAY